MANHDYIIVGRGLAGSVVGLSLLKQNRKILIIDEASLSSSSKVAVGLFQPMTFKRTVETWKGYDSILAATEFYKWAEEILKEKFFHPLPMHRIFSSYEEQNNWSLKFTEPNFNNLIGEEKSVDADQCNPKFGYGNVFHAGYLDVPKFLLAAEEYFSKNDAYLSEKFDFSSLSITSDGVKYKNLSSPKIIFCEGWLIKDNPWFGYIPMKPVKGEILTIKIPQRKINSIISGGLFCVPRENGSYKIGSNYEWKNLDEIPTEKIRNDFTNEISQILNINQVQTVSQVAGIRPASHDRRPILGSHPQFENLYVFNGLGARGVALAPYAVDFLVQNLTSNTEIPNEMNVSRFNKFYCKQS